MNLSSLFLCGCSKTITLPCLCIAKSWLFRAARLRGHVTQNAAGDAAGKIIRSARAYFPAPLLMTLLILEWQRGDDKSFSLCTSQGSNLEFWDKMMMPLKEKKKTVYSLGVRFLTC